jgi:hypothetical protein
MMLVSNNNKNSNVLNAVPENLKNNAGAPVLALAKNCPLII